MADVSAASRVSAATEGEAVDGAVVAKKIAATACAALQIARLQDRANNVGRDALRTRAESSCHSSSCIHSHLPRNDTNARR